MANYKSKTHQRLQEELEKYSEAELIIYQDHMLKTAKIISATIAENPDGWVQTMVNPQIHKSVADKIIQALANVAKKE